MDVILLIISLILLIIAFVSFLLLAIFVFSIFFGAPYVPSFSSNVEKMIELSNPQKGEVFYDLGSGDGKVVIQVAKNFDVKAIGIEINPLLVVYSRWRIKKLGLEKKAKIRWGNIFRENIGDADFIFTYLLQPTNNFLEKRLLEKLKPGTRIVSLAFTFKKIPLVKNDKGVRLYKI